ncbi:MAG: LuxR C-terminal-related transcriptional regulator [Flavobacteriaceae bacterium]|jgi:DNA-binding CsgD family transcriptional regulator|nr:LuxR C-terminal-related transcriptional regulator [Flavobacteriaceae bacterium]
MADIIFLGVEQLIAYSLESLIKEVTSQKISYHQVVSLKELKTKLHLKKDIIVFINPNHINVEQQMRDVVLLHEQFVEVKWVLVFGELSEYWLKLLAHQRGELFNSFMKCDTLIEIKQAITTIINDGVFVSQSIQDRLLSHQEVLNKVDEVLTNSEREILKEIASGKMTKEIAADRNVSVHTIITHRKNIFRKLGVNSIHEATMYALKGGMIDMNDYSI